MANFSTFNSLCFPSPIVSRNSLNNPTPVSSGFTNPLLTSVTPSSCTLSVCSSVIQFPSPVYTTSASTPSMKTEYSKPRMNLLPTNYGFDTVNYHPASLYEAGSGSTAENILGNGWQCNVPSTMPWAVSERGQQNFVQFTAANSSSHTSLVNRIAPVHNIHTRRLKRRVTHTAVDDRPDNKVFINEDRVAESMRNLHLSGNTVSAIDPNQAWYTTQILREGGSGEMEQEEPVCTSSPTIKLSRELEAGLAKRDLVQQLIEEEMNKSCKQIVLWTPPGGHINELLSGVKTSDTMPLKRSMDVIDMGLQSPKKASKLPVNDRRANHRSPGRGDSPMSQPIGQPTCQSSVSMETSLESTNSMEAVTSQMNTGLPRNGLNSAQANQSHSDSITDSLNYFCNNNNVQSQNSVPSLEQQTPFPAVLHSCENVTHSQRTQNLTTPALSPIPVYSRQTFDVATPEHSNCLDLMDDEDLDL